MNQKRVTGAESLMALVIILIGSFGLVSAAAPPDRVNFQGVLRDAGGGPKTGSLDMTFRYFDAVTAGNEIMVEAHLAAGTGAVVVDNGLFNIVLGTGALSDGAAVLPGDPYLVLGRVFSDFTDVWIEIEIVSAMGPETLSPRVRFASAPYALNASHLSGKAGPEYLDTSSDNQTKAGRLSVAQLALSDQVISFASGSMVYGQDSGVSVRAGDDQNDAIGLVAGTGVLQGGGLLINPGVKFWSSDGSFQLQHSGEVFSRFSIGDSGASVHRELRVIGGLIRFTAGFAGTITSDDSGLTLTAGASDDDDLLLLGGNTLDDGGVRIEGDGEFYLESGNGSFRFVNGAGSSETANLDASGSLQLDGDLTISGDQLYFGMAGARIEASPLELRLWAGGTDRDLILLAGDDANDGSLALLGDGQVSLTAGDGVFGFYNGAVPGEIAHLDASGSLQIDGDLTVSGNDITAATNLDLNSGPGSSNFVALVSNGNVFSHFDSDNNSSSVVSWCVNGSCIAPGTQMQLDESGNLRVGGTLSQNQFDLAESYLMGEPLEPGDVVRLHPQIKGAVLLSAGADDATVLGVVSERPGVLLGGAPFGAERLEQMWGAGMKARFLEERERRMELVRSRDFEPAADTTRLEAARADAPPSADEEAIIEAEALQEFYADHFAPVALAGRVPVKVDAGFGAIEAGDPLAPSPIPGVAMKADGTGPTIAIALERFSGGRGKVEAFIVRGQAPPGSSRLGEARLTEQIEARTPDPATGIQKVAGHLQVVLDRDEDDEARFSIFRDGEEAQLASEVFRVDEQGNVFAKGAVRPDAMDLAEMFAVSVGVEEGDLLVADPEAPGRYKPCDEAGDPAVVGVVAGRPGVLLGSGFERMAAAAPDLASKVEEARQSGDRIKEAHAWRGLEARFLETHAPVSLAGTILVKVDAGYGAVKAGDLLTTSPTPGHAMRADDPRPGIVVGKALESIEGGTGLIRMLVMLR